MKVSRIKEFPFTLSMPIPPATLSPNSRASRWDVIRARKKHRAACSMEMLAQGLHGPIKTKAPRFPIEFTLFPETNRNRDDDNLIASTKTMRDELAKVLRVDDSRIITGTARFAPVDKQNPRLMLTVTEVFDADPPNGGAT